MKIVVAAASIAIAFTLAGCKEDNTDQIVAHTKATADRIEQLNKKIDTLNGTVTKLEESVGKFEKPKRAAVQVGPLTCTPIACDSVMIIDICATKMKYTTGVLIHPNYIVCID